ncbi:hypothetical protein BKA70DRAFT_795989 [Coprinopsis sp. MPI-PUGE-AT-0042]|nr:hypothetical protein BKA70DRAFT_795989 [Coprinopsis sp. MPI-PUGE-AT-0042]
MFARMRWPRGQIPRGGRRLTCLLHTSCFNISFATALVIVGRLAPHYIELMPTSRSLLHANQHASHTGSTTSEHRAPTWVLINGVASLILSISQ